MCACRAQAYVGAFLRRPNGSREAANAESLEGDLHLDENGQIIRPAARTEDGAADPADAMHDVGTFAQVRRVYCCLFLCLAGNCPAMLLTVVHPVIAHTEPGSDVDRCTR